MDVSSTSKDPTHQVLSALFEAKLSFLLLLFLFLKSTIWKLLEAGVTWTMHGLSDLISLWVIP